MLKDLTLDPLVASARVLDSLGIIDERLLRCGISRRAFVQFCSSLRIAAPFGLAITDKNTLEEVAAGVELYLKVGMVWACLWGVRSIGTKNIVLIDRIVVLKNRRISLLPLCNAKCDMQHAPAVYSRHVHTAVIFHSHFTLYSRTPPKPVNPFLPCNKCDASGA
jgi:hypothetical protein